MKILNFKEWDYSWNDDDLFGELIINCPCGNRIEGSNLGRQDIPIVCEKCNRTFII